MKRTQFFVQYGHHAARFTSWRDAMHFARDKSDVTLGCVEVRDANGLIGQFLSGHATPEFRTHWAEALKSPA